MGIIHAIANIPAEKWALLISGLSFVVSAIVAKKTIFKSAKIEGVMQHWHSWQFSSYQGKNPEGIVVSRLVTPNLKLRNHGAQPAIISDLRIKCITDKETVYLYPREYVGDKFIDSPDTTDRQIGLGNFALFSGVMLSANEEWKNCYAFSAGKEKFEFLKGDIATEVQIRKGRNSKWQTVLKTVMEFGEAPLHLRPMATEMSKSGCIFGPVYSNEWRESRERNRGND